MVFCGSFNTVSLKVKFSAAWQKGLQARAKHIPKISSEIKNNNSSFLSIRLKQGEDRSHPLKQAWRNSSRCSKRLALGSTVTFLPCFMALFNTHHIMVPGDPSAAKHKLSWPKLSLPWEGVDKIFLLFGLRNLASFLVFQFGFFVWFVCISIVLIESKQW